MQVTETHNEGLKRAYKLILTAQELDDKVNAKLAEAQPEVEMKGFRKGKVPMALLKKQFGQRVLGEAMQEAVDGAMNEHFESSGDRPAMQPEVKMTNEDWKEGDDVEVSLEYERLPDIPDVDFAAIKLERLVAKVEEADLEEALKGLAENVTNYEDRKKGAKAKNDDQVVMDFVGKVDGEPFEGGSAEDYPLVLGSNAFIPGFEEQLVGVKAGEEKAVTVSFPEDYGAEHLAGKEAVFDCTIKAVKAPKPAEIDEDLAKQYGEESLETLKEKLSERIAAEFSQASRQLTKRQLLDELDKAVKFDLPPTLVETEAKQIAHQLWHEENPDVEGHDHGEIEPDDEQKALAERRVRLGLLLAEIGAKNEIEVTDQEMTQAVMNEARKYPGHEQQFFQFVQQNPQMQQQMRAPIFEDKVVDYIFELTEITEKEVSKDDLKTAVEALDDA